MDCAALLKQVDAWWLMAFYSVTFGGFVGLAASLPIYFTDQFGLTTVVAVTAPPSLRLCRFAGVRWAARWPTGSVASRR
jgi:nitrate/nitrite transporter NarK